MGRRASTIRQLCPFRTPLQALWIVAPEPGGFRALQETRFACGPGVPISLGSRVFTGAVDKKCCDQRVSRRAVTHLFQLRRATLYPAELRVREGSFSRLARGRQRPNRGCFGQAARRERQGSGARIVSGAPERMRRECRDCGGSISLEDVAYEGSFCTPGPPVCKCHLVRQNGLFAQGIRCSVQ